jgi:hypothetical protein
MSQYKPLNAANLRKKGNPGLCPETQPKNGFIFFNHESALQALLGSQGI